MKKLILSLSLVATSNAFSEVNSYCRSAESVKKLSLELSGKNLICLDSYQIEKGESVLFYSKDSVESLILVKLEKTATPEMNITSIEKIDDQKLFPVGCGDSLLGARIIPRTDLVAMLYDRFVIRVVDVKSNDILDIVDFRNPNIGSTCHYSLPRPSARRKDVTIELDKKNIKLHYIYQDENNDNDIVVTETIDGPLSESERSDLEAQEREVVEDISYRTNRMNTARTPFDIEFQKTLIKHLEYRLFTLRKQLSTGNKIQFRSNHKFRSGVLIYN